MKLIKLFSFIHAIKWQNGQMFSVIKIIKHQDLVRFFFVN
jgi:hypothetical protein